jgi:hypothetical protein
MDFFLVENYGQALIGHAGDGTYERGTSLDGSYRNGIARSPIVNCHGLWEDQQIGTKTFGNHPSAPKSTRSAMWLSVVTTEMLSQLVFILDPRSPSGSGNISSDDGFQPWPSPLIPGGGWVQTIQVGIFAEQLKALLPSFLRPFELGPHPALTVTASKMLRPSASTAGLPGTVPVPIRARAWEEGPCAKAASSCLHVVVVNVLEDAPVQYTVEIESPKTVAEAMRRRGGSEAGVTTINATRLFDAGYNVSLVFVGDKIVLEDFLGPGDVAIFEIGCEGPKPTMGSDGVWSAWEPCANRRVQCWDHYGPCTGV